MELKVSLKGHSDQVWEVKFSTNEPGPRLGKKRGKNGEVKRGVNLEKMGDVSGLLVDMSLISHW